MGADTFSLFGVFPYTPGPHTESREVFKRKPPKPRKYRTLLDVPDFRVSLLFDGTHLHWKDGDIVKSWPAYSGEEEFWMNGNFSKEAQKVKNKGPLPEGFYLARQDKLEERPGGLGHNLVYLARRGTWPGSDIAWGKHRVWLQPRGDTEMFGRSGLTIHGGWYPGSAGCIDLVDKLPEFIELFQRHGKDVWLEVRYPQGGK